MPPFRGESPRPAGAGRGPRRPPPRPFARRDLGADGRPPLARRPEETRPRLRVRRRADAARAARPSPEPPLILEPAPPPRAPELLLPPLERRARVAVVGTGPAGLFAALALADAGVSLVVLERGDAAEERYRKVMRFWKSGDFDPDSNVQFGEGGGGDVQRRQADVRQAARQDRRRPRDAPPFRRPRHDPLRRQAAHRDRPARRRPAQHPKAPDRPRRRDALPGQGRRRPPRGGGRPPPRPRPGGRRGGPVRRGDLRPRPFREGHGREAPRPGPRDVVEGLRDGGADRAPAGRRRPHPVRARRLLVRRDAGRLQDDRAGLRRSRGLHLLHVPRRGGDRLLVGGGRGRDERDVALQARVGLRELRPRRPDAPRRLRGGGGPPGPSRRRVPAARRASRLRGGGRELRGARDPRDRLPLRPRAANRSRGGPTRPPASRAVLTPSIQRPTWKLSARRSASSTGRCAASSRRKRSWSPPSRARRRRSGSSGTRRASRRRCPASFPPAKGRALRAGSSRRRSTACAWRAP
ncbi:MAG: FAD-dependent monooxygenase [Holophagales bacterium]|nr:FAD-dependent monooxygenase [Holophagales bacterium]